MSWRTEWSALANQIQGLVEAGHFLFLSTRDTKTENRTVFKHVLMPHSKTIYQNIQKFLDTYESSISAAAIECLKRFMNKYKELCSDDNWTKLQNVQAALTLLASFRSELSFHLSDIQAVSRRLTERAFVHLQRSIVADPSVKERWKEAFNSGETSCERLGAAHLLSHGIWAFKASAEGERTDLILGEPLRDLSQVEDTSESLVLTEWKVVRNPKRELEEKADQALKQAKRYSAGILAGFELTSYRYLTIVSEDVLQMPSDIIENDVTYRYVSIPVDPSPPSKS